MNTARIVVLAIAIGAGGIAAYLASGSDPQPAQQAAAPSQKLDTVDVLVARSDIPIGQTIKDDDIQWQIWPAGAASSSLIRRSDRGEAIKQLTGSIARGPFFAGEPIRDAKLVRADGSGFMAAILPSGMRAISTEISPETGAGGFILPNDRVDVISSRRERNPDRNAAAQETVNSEIILNNVRVLAIDQTVEEKNGQKVVVGKTATLELKPEQSETLARARQLGTLSLALRSITDAHAPDNAEERKKRGETINIVRFGVSTTAVNNK